jgi:TRAP-type mannitol/chloroaromatic compound transport system substrate-binding protein
MKRKKINFILKRACEKAAIPYEMIQKEIDKAIKNLKELQNKKQ